MLTFNSKWHYLFLLLGVQLIVMALLSREAYHKRVTYFLRIFRKTDTVSGLGAGHGTNRTGADVYANLSQLVLLPNKDDMHYCPKTSPLLSKCARAHTHPYSLDLCFLFYHPDPKAQQKYFQ